MIDRFYIVWVSSLHLLISSTIYGFPLDLNRPFAVMRKTARMSTTESPFQPADYVKNPAPLYITIGPQCCGKTTLLQDIDSLNDVCLDNQLDVYVPVTTEQWMDLLNTATDEEVEDRGEVPIPEELQQQVQGKTIAQRIQNDNPELNLILQRWNGDLSSSSFADAIADHYANITQANHGTKNSNVADTLIQVVEDFLSKSPQLPAKTDVFCLESLFQPHAKTNLSAIEVAHDLLKKTPSHIPLAWGNTNSKAKDFQQALDIACSTGRPVHFLLCHPTWKLENDKWNIPWVELSALLERNLQRLATSGRYIPANAIADCCLRIEKQLIPSDCESPWDVEQALVFQSTQPVRRHEKPLPFRYFLTRERLIRKGSSEERRPGPVRRQDQTREYPRGAGRFSRAGQRRHFRGWAQDDRRRDHDDRRRFDGDGRAGRWGQDDRRSARGSGRGQGQSQGRGKRGYSDQDQRGGDSYPLENDKRHRR